MIVFNIISSNQAQTDAIVDCILKNNYANDVIVGDPMNSFRMNSMNMKESFPVNVIRFITKSLLFSEIESTLVKAFGRKDYLIYSTPVIQTDEVFFDTTKNLIKPSLV